MPTSSKPNSIIPEKVTRIQVLDVDGHLHEFFAKSWQTSVQDGQRTLKLFAQGTSAQAEQSRRGRNSSLAEDLAMISKVASALNQGQTRNIKKTRTEP